MSEMKDDNINLFPQLDAYWEIRDDGIAVRNPGGFHKTPEDLVAAYRTSKGRYEHAGAEGCRPMGEDQRKGWPLSVSHRPTGRDEGADPGELGSAGR